MARRTTEIKARAFIVQADGTSRLMEHMTQSELESFAESLTNRIGNALNDYFNAHPKEYGRI